MTTTVADADVEVHADLSKFGRELERKLQPIIKAIDAVLKVDGDAKPLQETVAREKRRASNDKITLTIRGDTTSAGRSIARLRTRNTMTLKVNADSSGAEQVISKVLGGAFGQFGNVTSGLGAVSESVSAVGRSASSSVPGIVAMGMALAALPLALIAVKAIVGSLLPLLLLVPGVLVAIAAATGAVVLGSRHFIDAMKGDEKALEKLTPAAREFVKTLRDLKPEFHDIRALTQENLFQGLADPIRTLITSYLPSFKGLLGDVALSLNKGVRGALESVNSEANRIRIDKLFESMAKGADALALTLKPIIDILIIIAQEGAKAFERVAPAMVSGLNRVRDSLAEASDAGDFQKAFEKGIQTGKALLALGSAINRVFTNLATPFTTGLEDVFGDSDTVHRIQAFAAALDGLGRTLGNDRVQTGLRTLGQIAAVLNAPLILLVATIILFGIGLAYTIGLLSDLRKGFKEFADGLIGDVLENLGQAYQKILDFARKIRDLFNDPLGPASPTGGTAFGGPFGGGFSAETIRQLEIDFQIIRDFLSGKILELGLEWNKLPVQAGVSLSLLPSVVGSQFSLAFGIATNIASMGVDQIGATVGLIPGYVEGALGPLPGIFGGRIGQAVAIGVNTLRVGASQMVGVLGSIPPLAYSAGQRIVQYLIDGLRSKLRDLQSVASAVAGAISSRLPRSPAKTGPLSGQGSPQISGAKIVRMLADGLRSEQRLLAASVGDTLGVLSSDQLAVRAPGIQLAPTSSVAPAPYRADSAASTTTTTNYSPQITVNSASADPEAVANRVLRRLSWGAA